MRNYGNNDVEVGKHYGIEIVEIANIGDGAGYHKDTRIIVKGTKIGDKIIVKIQYIKEECAFGFIIKKLNRDSQKYEGTAAKGYETNFHNGGTQASSPWKGSGGGGGHFFSGDGTFCGRCPECKGAMVRDKKRAEAYCEKCGYVKR